MNKNNFGLFVIKPDAVQDGIDQDIIEDIEKEGFFVLARKKHQFLPSEIKYLIDPKDLGKRHKTSFGIVNNYLSGESVILALHANDGDSVERVRELKGSIDKGGIRKKYYPYNLDEVNNLEDTNPVQFGLMRGRNRVHCPDNNKETLALAHLLFSPDEIAKFNGVSGETEQSKNSVKLEKDG